MASSDKRKALINLYETSVEQTLDRIGEILKDSDLSEQVGLDIYDEILKKASASISRKWREGKKYLRTEFVLKMLDDTYPEDVLLDSLSMDAMINILDDILDENLGSEAKTLYIIEYLRIFAVFSRGNSSQRISSNISAYFEKLITLAIAEDTLQEKIESLKELDAMVKLSSTLLLSRARDVDIFLEIPLTYQRKFDLLSMMQHGARVFRAINILKKDIIDFDHDVSTGQKTLITFMKSKKEDMYPSYVKQLVQEIKSQFNYVAIQTEHQEVANLINMIENEERDLVNVLS